MDLILLNEGKKMNDFIMNILPQINNQIDMVESAIVNESLSYAEIELEKLRVIINGIQKLAQGE